MGGPGTCSLIVVRLWSTALEVVKLAGSFQIGRRGRNYLLCRGITCSPFLAFGDRPAELRLFGLLGAARALPSIEGRILTQPFATLGFFGGIEEKSHRLHVF